MLALRLLLREWRSGELGVLLAALSIAVAALTGVGFLVDRIDAAIDLQAREVLAADLRLRSRNPMVSHIFDEAARRGVASARVASLLTVVFHGEQSQLANIRAVSSGYPLRGRVRISSQPFTAGHETRAIPGRGEVWADSRLLAATGAQIGSPLSIGTATLKVTQVLISRPDQGGAFSDLAPNLIINDADLPGTQLIQPGSRVGYAALFAGDKAMVAAFKTWLAANKQPGERLMDVEEASPQIHTAVDRAGRFLSLASLVSVLLCCIAVAMSARRYVQRHLDVVALMKTLGATRRLTLTVSYLQLLCIALLATAIGSLVGFGVQEWLLHALRGLFATELPAASAAPLALGLLAAVAVLSGFALPPLLQLSRVPALRVLRRDIGPPPTLVLLAFGPAVLVILGLIAWVVRELRLFLQVSAGLVVFIAVLTLAGLALVSVAGRLRTSVGVSWRYGIANLSRRRAESVLQIACFGTGLMVLLVLGLVHGDLLDDWRRALPVDAPNYFFINIPADKRVEFVQFLQAQGGRTTRVLPMIRGRMTQIRGRPIATLALQGERGEEFSQREQNLTWTPTLGDDNAIVAGRWWTANDTGKPLVSVATEYAESLNIHVGDTLSFDIAGEPLTATVASIRKVKWDSFQPNFFLVFAPGVLDETAGSYLTSAFLRPEQARSLAQLAKRFPGVSIFDIDDMLTQVRTMADKAALAVQSVFLFTLFAGLTVLLAAVQASRDQRRFESAILRTLGASRRVVALGVIAEFLTLGLLAGALAAAGASIGGYFLATRVLQIPYTLDQRVWLVGVLGGAALVAISGWIATRSVVHQPPLATLRTNYQ